MRLRCGIGLSMFAALACAGQSVTPPRPMLDELKTAVERKDSAALHALLDTEARRASSPQEVERLLSESRAELLERARAFTSDSARVTTTAVVRYPDGGSATLRFEDGRFRIASGATLAGASTPVEALGELRSALVTRNTSALERVLTDDTRVSLARQLDGLVLGLEQPETLHVERRGETARVSIPGGHWVELRREDGVWRVRDFE